MGDGTKKELEGSHDSPHVYRSWHGQGYDRGIPGAGDDLMEWDNQNSLKHAEGHANIPVLHSMSRS